MPEKTIGIIGAGPAGLAALKAVLDSEQYKAGIWTPIVFESREDLGGIWFPSPAEAADPPLTPLYDSFITNLPHPLMGFRSFLFPPETPLFPKAAIVHQYLKDFASHFALRPHIKFSASVTSVKYTPEQTRRWLVETSTGDSYHFDLIMVCTGHYRFPLYPSIPGVSDWLEAKKASHLTYYRQMLPIHKRKTILVVGCGPSGIDLARNLDEYGCNVILSGFTRFPITFPPSIRRRARLASLGSFSEGVATYADGTVDKGVDYCFFATGYKLDFNPFLQLPVLNDAHPRPIQPLPSELHITTYSLFPLAQHLWPLQNQHPPETMAFFGLLLMLAHFPVFEIQAQAVLHAFNVFDNGVEDGSGARGIDQQAEALDVAMRWEMLKNTFNGDEKDVLKYWHRLKDVEQFTYRDHLSGLVQEDPSRVEEWEYEILQKAVSLRATWVKIEKSGRAREWLKGVGNGGLDDWIALMKRVIEYGEGLDNKGGWHNAKL